MSGHLCLLKEQNAILKNREDTAIVPKLKLKEYLKAEVNGTGFKFFINILFNPLYNVIFLIRCYQCCKNKMLKKILYRKLIYSYGIFIGEKVEIGIGVKLPHPNGIVFGQGVKLGDHCTIYQQVTFGVKGFGEDKYPVIGNDCIFGAGSKVLGDIHVADGSTVGANAVLIDSTVKKGVYVGSPARNIGVTE